MQEKDTSKKILILTPFYPPNTGGAETFCHDLVQTISEYHNVDVLTFQPFEGGFVDYQEYNCGKGSINIRRIKWGIKHKTAWQGISFRNFFSVFPKMFFHARSLIKTNRYDVVHAQGLLSAMVAVLLHKKVFITLLALYDFPSQKWYVNKLTQFVLNRCEKIFVEGENGANDIRQFNVDKKVRMFNHWTDHKIFCLPDKRTDKTTNILFVGRPIKIKGMHIIKGAEKIINNNKYRFEYVTKVKFQKLPEIYKRNHICCVPSLYDEGYSRVVMEASSCGCAIITSDRGSLPEQVRKFGIYIKATPRNFSDVIKGVDHKKYGERAYKYSRKYFSKDNAKVFLDAYENGNIR